MEYFHHVQWRKENEILIHATIAKTALVYTNVMGGLLPVEMLRIF